MWNTGPSLVTMPAASCPRCCSSSKPSYKSWLTGVCVTAPMMPHMFRSTPLSLSPGRYDRFRRSSFPAPIVEPVRQHLRQPRAQAQRPGDKHRTRVRILPPIALRQCRQSGEQHEQHRNENASRNADDRPQQPIEEPEADRPQQPREKKANQRARDEYDGQNDRERHHVAHRGRLAEVGQHIAEWAREANRREHADHPSDERSDHANEAAPEREHHRQADDADEKKIERRHPLRVTTPSKPAALSFARAESATSRDEYGPTRTRCNVPLSVATASVYPGKPSRLSLITSERAP